MLRLPHDIEKGRIYEWLVNHKQGHERLFLTEEQFAIVLTLPEFFPAVGDGFNKIHGMTIHLI